MQRRIRRIQRACFDEAPSTGKAPADIVREKGLTVIADAGALEAVVEKVLADHAGVAAEFRAGKAGSKNFLVG